MDGEKNQGLWMEKGNELHCLTFEIFSSSLEFLLGTIANDNEKGSHCTPSKEHRDSTQAVYTGKFTSSMSRIRSLPHLGKIFRVYILRKDVNNVWTKQQNLFSPKVCNSFKHCAGDTAV